MYLDVKSKKVNFKNQLHLLCSSLTRRSSQYLYVGVLDIPNTIVLTNGSYDLLSAYIPSSLSVSVITLNENLYNALLFFLKIDGKSPYVLRTSAFLKILKLFSEDKDIYLSIKNGSIVAEHIEFQDDPEAERKESSSEDEDDEDDDDDNYHPIVMASGVIGAEVPPRNIMAINTLKVICMDILTCSDTEYLQKNSIPFISENIETIEFRKLTNDSYKYAKNYGDLSDNKTIYTKFLDGLDIPSLREFCKKKKITHLTKILWRENDVFTNIFVYEDNLYKIRMCRPYTFQISIQHNKNT